MKRSTFIRSCFSVGVLAIPLFSLIPVEPIKKYVDIPEWVVKHFKISKKYHPHFRLWVSHAYNLEHEEKMIIVEEKSFLPHVLTIERKEDGILYCFDSPKRSLDEEMVTEVGWFSNEGELEKYKSWNRRIKK